MSADENRLELGKIPPGLLDKLLSAMPKAPEILIGPQSGEDAAIVAGSDRLIVTADPITFTEEDIGIYTAAVNCNDIVAMGGSPLYLVTTILLPPHTKRTTVEKIFNDIGKAAEKLGVLWVGGHTEVTPAVRNIVVSGHAIGFLTREPTPSSNANADRASNCQTRGSGRPLGRGSPTNSAKRFVPRMICCSGRSRNTSW